MEVINISTLYVVNSNNPRLLWERKCIGVMTGKYKKEMLLRELINLLALKIS